MPFEERNGNVNLTVPYGQQPNPQTGEDWFHHGVDFATNKYLLAAVADGIVSGIGVDREEHGMFIVIKYGKYEVTYSGLSNIYAQFGHKVKAGTCVAQSGDVLHLGVRFDNKEMDPMDFITMLFGNVKMWSQRDVPQPEIAFTEMELFTDYEKEKDEIEQLMLRYYANYMSDMHNGIYLVPQRTGESMRNILSFGAMKHYFYETMPSMLNPLGLGNKSIPLVTKAQNLLISDFLNYLALRHHIYLSTMDALSKKKSADSKSRGFGGFTLIDPLAELDIDVQSFDIPRIVSVYADRAGIRFWTKAPVFRKKTPKIAFAVLSTRIIADYLE